MMSRQMSKMAPMALGKAGIPGVRGGEAAEEEGEPPSPWTPPSGAARTRTSARGEGAGIPGVREGAPSGAAGGMGGRGEATISGMWEREAHSSRTGPMMMMMATKAPGRTAVTKSAALVGVMTQKWRIVLHIHLREHHATGNGGS